MKLVKILSVLAVFAATGMMLAGCDSPAGSGNGGEVVFTKEAAPESAGAANAHGSLAGTTYHIAIKVANGGRGLKENSVVVSDATDSILVKNRHQYSIDHTINISAPRDTPYLIIRWCGTEVWTLTRSYLKAKLYNPGDTNMLKCYIDYNGDMNVYTEGLSEVSYHPWQKPANDFENAWNKAAWN